VNSDEIRSAYLKFFEEKGHKVIPSSSLIPKDNPTLLLTTAGVVQIQPYILGQAVPPSKRLASCQKCFRTTDIESVGDATHMTFFEMLGNWSVGDYFKKEAIAWAWEFVTERLHLPPDKLWITIYLDDEEAFDFWRAIGIPKSKIVRCDAKDNFWGPPGSSGPCGPCSEIHFDLGQERSCGPDCKPNDGCGRFVEIWNLVFMQYFQDEQGKRTPLPHPCVDTGMGLERTLTAINGKKTAYDTDVFTPLLDIIAGLTGKKYGANADDDNATRIVAEHGRALAFLIADGVLPDNEGRSYVLRRLLRRAALFGRRLGLNKPFLSEIAKTAIKKMSHVYPELKQRQDMIIKIITMEEERFEETLNTGLAIIEELISKQAGKKDKQISGADAFKLYDTYGFPVELTREIVAKSGFPVDMAGFDKEMEKQRERARSTHKFDVAAKMGGVSLSKLDVKATEFVGYHCYEQKAKVLKLLVDGKEVEKVEKGQKVGLVLDTSPFYAEMGGQLGDTGKIVGANGKFTVNDSVRIPTDITLHQGKVSEGSLRVGDEVKAAVDMERRLDISRNHSATHLLQAALRQVLGEHIQQRGSLVAPERLRFDFSHLAAMTQDEIKAVQRIVNDKIRQNLKVSDEQTAYKKAIEAGATALFDEKYGDVVRVMRIGEPAVSTELCGGTHISFTGEIGYFQILSEGSIGAGLRRIEAVTGRGAEAFLDQRLTSLNSTAQSLETKPEDVEEKVTQLIANSERFQKLVSSFEKDKARKEAESLLGRVETVNGVKVLAARVASSDQQVLRGMADFLRDKLESGIVVLGAVIGERPVFIATVTPDLVQKGHNAGDIIKQVSRVAGGGGGGKANFAQAGGKDKEKLDEALRLVKSLIK
jgi:alanyl-tRNA synthetase